MSSFNHLLKRSTLSIIYQKFNSAIFTEADVKNAICESYSIAPNEVTTVLKRLFQAGYITTVEGEWPTGYYQFVNPFVWNERKNDKTESMVKNDRCMNPTKPGENEMVNFSTLKLWSLRFYVLVT